MKIAVIGGGASGLTAAIAAARLGADVTVYEKMNRVGKKILATGNGRCNYTNMNMCIDRYHGKNIEMAENIFVKFGLNKTLAFFENLGIYPYIDDSGKVYPNSLQSSSILDVLMYEIERLKIEVITDFDVERLSKTKEKFSIIGKENIYYADKVILCCGGKASPQFGADGSGYKLCENHTIVDTFPALVQLKLNKNYLKKISGVRFDGVVKGFTDDKVIREEPGEILFTDYGISGPAILQISRMVLNEFNKNQKVYLSVDMFPNLNKNMIYELLSERFQKINYKVLEDSLVGFINKKFIPVIMIETGLEYKDVKCGKLNKKEIYKIINVLKEWKFEVTGHNTWQQAQVTAGGIDLRDVDMDTLESKKTKGMHIAGEILDVDGDCGGYNLQWAWSSGYTAGHCAAMNKTKGV